MFEDRELVALLASVRKRTPPEKSREFPSSQIGNGKCLSSEQFLVSTGFSDGNHVEPHSLARLLAGLLGVQSRVVSELELASCS